jgi:hypothetical protein
VSTYSYGGDPSANDKDAVRSEIRDTNSSAWLLSDAEVDWYILDENQVAAGTPTKITQASLYRPAARCCEVISRMFLAQADTQVGQLKVTSTKRAEQYLAMAKEFREKARGFQAPYVGGQSETEKASFESNSDAVLPAFTRTEWDNPWVGSQTGYGIDSEDFGPPVQ